MWNRVGEAVHRSNLSAIGFYVIFRGFVLPTRCAAKEITIRPSVSPGGDGHGGHCAKFAPELVAC